MKEHIKIRSEENEIIVIETRIEKTSIVLAVIGVFFLIIGQYLFSIILLSSVAYSCYIYFRNGLVEISLEEDRIQYICMRNFRLKSETVFRSELTQESLQVNKRITGLTSYDELILIKDNDILFRDSALGLRNLGDDMKTILIKKFDFFINKNEN